MEYSQIIFDYIFSIADTMALLYVIKAAFLNDLNLSRRIWIGNAFVIGISSLLKGMIGEEIFYVILVLFLPMATILATYKKNSLKKIKYILPGILLLFIPAEVILLGTNLITQEMFRDTKWYEVSGGIFDVFVILIIHKKMQHIQTRIKLNKWDIILISSINILTLSVIIGIEAIQNQWNLGNKEQQIVWILSALTMLIDFFTIYSIIKGKAASYYKFVQKQNQLYLESQSAYFEDYKKNQQELRRFRHDCKNHFFCMSELAKENKYEELSSYLANLTEEFSKGSPFSSTGNDIVDAVLHEKARQMKENDIRFILDGRFSKELAASSIDLCTIFANALDNAIEAVKSITDQGKKVIQVEIKSTDYYCVIAIHNFYEGSIYKKGKYYKTTKKDIENHGLGIENISLAVLSNQGDVSIHAENQEFIVECILPYKE